MNSPWLRRFDAAPPDDTRTTEFLLICFPHAGGAASSYLPLSRALAPEIGVVSVQYPGRQDRRREPPCTSLMALARAVADELEHQLRPRQQYALFGHSMGAVVAYETARLLAERDLPMPGRLFLSGRGAPSATPRPGDLLSDDAALIAEIRRLGGTGRRVLDDPELLHLALPALRADYRALGGHRDRPGPPLDVPFTVMVGDADPVVAVDDARGWLAHSLRDSRLLTYPGGHFYLDDNIARVAGDLRHALAADVPV
ncbi:thioesterase II family protein [Streptomyces coeruleorubidus]|uniref:thioesterase II family protein n=1 Tax=Streptomyces coeruleorubidus TaxID=116188 RepID=UPI003791DDD7